MITRNYYNKIVALALVTLFVFGMAPSLLINAHAKSISNNTDTWIIEVDSKEEQDAVLAQIAKENRAVENAWVRDTNNPPTMALSPKKASATATKVYKHTYYSSIANKTVNVNGSYATVQFSATYDYQTKGKVSTFTKIHSVSAYATDNKGSVKVLSKDRNYTNNKTILETHFSLKVTVKNVVTNSSKTTTKTFYAQFYPGKKTAQAVEK